MSKLKLLNLLIAVEVLLCIHRNYSYLKKNHKVLAVARVIIEIIFNLAICLIIILQILYAKIDLFIASKHILYVVLSTINSLVPIIIGLCRTYSFKILKKSIDSVHEYCLGDVTYEKKIKSQRKTVLGVCAFIAFYAIFFLYCLLATHPWSSEDQYTYNASDVITSFWMVLKNSRFHFEILTINVLIKIINISLAQLKTKLETFSKALDDSLDGIDDLTCYQFQQELEQWFLAYKNLKLCRDGINRCFGIQIAVLLCLLAYVFISSGYSMLAGVIPGETQLVVINLMLLFDYTIAMIVLLYTCQSAQNEEEVLNRCMLKFYSKILTIPGPNALTLKRLVKDCHRQMAVQPITIQIMSTTNSKMSLLLAILSTGISYVIVLLQFRHVV